MLRPRWYAWLVALLALAGPAIGDEFFFKDGDRIVMMGDSITEQHLYSNYVEMWTVTRFPNWKLTFRNVGIGGDRSVGGNTRFKRDVTAFHPTALTVDFGMNDGGSRPFDQGLFQAYLNGLQGIADQAKSADIRVAWITPQPLDNDDAGPTALTGYNQTLEKFSDGLRTVAEKNHGLFVDQFHPYLAVLNRARAETPAYKRFSEGNPVHPGPPGQALMAYAILKGLHFPALVSSAEIDLAIPDGVKTNACKVSDLRRDGNTVHFMREDAALPFFPPEARSLLKYATVLNELNVYTLKVTGLAAGRYGIRLGGKPVLECTAEELASGVNLADAALTAGPVADQVKAVQKAIEAKNRYYHDKIFRGLVLSQVSIPEWLGINMTASEIEKKRETAIAERLASLPKLDEAVVKTLAIKPHAVDIVPAGR